MTCVTNTDSINLYKSSKIVDEHIYFSVELYIYGLMNFDIKILGGSGFISEAANIPIHANDIRFFAMFCERLELLKWSLDCAIICKSNTTKER